MVIAGVLAFCVLIFVLAFVAPRLSRGPQRAGQGAMGFGSRGASKAPGKLGRWLSKPFQSGSRAIGESGAAGRRERRKSPV
jgi:hypothetical protein